MRQRGIGCRTRAQNPAALEKALFAAKKRIWLNNGISHDGGQHGWITHDEECGLGLFSDTSTMEFLGVPISLNMVAEACKGEGERITVRID